jgi:hypothetical protein
MLNQLGSFSVELALAEYRTATTVHALPRLSWTEDHVVVTYRDG